MKPHDLQWFKDRIGKRVYRENNKCRCKICVEVFEIGLIINDEIHAHYLLDCQNELGLIYTDNINKEMSNETQNNDELISSQSQLTQDIAKEYVQRILNANDGVMPFTHLHCSFTDERMGGDTKQYSFRHLVKIAFGFKD